MAGKQVVYKEEARHALMRGVNQLADAVKVTLRRRSRPRRRRDGRGIDADARQPGRLGRPFLPFQPHASL
jgi:hypothetical protein